MENHTIRKAVPADAKFISLLAKINFSEAYGNLFHSKKNLRTYINKVFSVENIKASLKKEENIFWIAFIGDLPIGYAKLKKNSPVPNTNFTNAAELQKVYILKEYAIKSNGEQLKVDFFKEIHQLQIHRVWLKELHTNEKTLNFYRAHNFHKYDSHSFSIEKEDFVFNIMMKTF
jgi:N-acetylglutamate synthase-like GNAT family acetyltransferase